MVMVKGIHAEQTAHAKALRCIWGMESNSLWPKGDVCARVGRDEAEEPSKGQIIKGLVCHTKELNRYPDVSGKPLENFKQGCDMLRCAI